MPALSAGVDDAGEQSENPQAGGGSGVVTELAHDHPVPQSALGLVVGEGRPGMVRYLEDGVPIVEQLHYQGVGFGMSMVRHAISPARRCKSLEGQTAGLSARHTQLPSGLSR